MSAIIEYQKLKGLTPDGDIGKKTLAAIQADCNIKSIIELIHFVGQCHHETGGFKASSENLNYSAEGLMKVFPKYFPNKALADSYARKPELIASRVYGNRMGNGDEASKEGYKYRGRGAIQLTGKDNYKLFGISINDPEILTNPDVVATKYFFKSADFFFDRNNLWSIAAKGISDDIIKQLTKRINGGYNGLEERIKYTKHYYQILTT
jgi:putative chitinase